MRAPEFWQGRGPLSGALLPAAALFAAAGALRRFWTRPQRAGVPIVCVGNLVAGGAGKTPLVLDLLARLRRRGLAAHALSRGYGGRLAGPVAVDPSRHSYREVGDEPLLLAETGPCWIARDRPAGAAAAVASGAAALVLDDGFQNPALSADLALLVIDGGQGLGNGRVIPAGPLRESLASGLARASAVVLIGADEAGMVEAIAGRRPVLRARLDPAVDPAPWAGRRVLAFAGIGRPEKFFATLGGIGAELVDRVAFADHHPYAEAEIADLVARARAAGGSPVTTAKDWVRLPPALRGAIEVLPIRLAWTAGDAAIEALLAGVLG